MKTCSVLSAAVLALMSCPLLAYDFPGTDFSLRLPAALNHVSIYGDAAAKGGAAAASKWGSSLNPAALVWGFPADYDYGLSAQYSNIAFDAGTQLHIMTEAVAFDAHDFGVFRVTLVQIASNESQVRNQPLDFDYDLQGVQLGWGLRLSESVTVGASTAYLNSEAKFKTDFLDFVDADKDTWNFKAGGLWQPAPKWLVGLVGDYSYGPSDTIFRVPGATGISQRRVSDIVRDYSFRPGISYEFVENALVHFDYQFQWLEGRSGSLALQRPMIGTDIPLARFFYLRTGAAMDQHENFSWTAGIGFYPHKGVALDLAYQNNMFPELQREFGRSRTLNASFSVQF